MLLLLLKTGQEHSQDPLTKLFESPSQAPPGWQAFQWTPVLFFPPLTSIFPVELLSEDPSHCFEDGEQEGKDVFIEEWFVEWSWCWESRSCWLCSGVWAGISSQDGELSSGTLARFSRPARLHASTFGVNAQRFRPYFERSSTWTSPFIFSLKLEVPHPLTLYPPHCSLD